MNSTLPSATMATLRGGVCFSIGEVYAPPEAFNRLLYVGATAALNGYEASVPETDLLFTLTDAGA